MRRWVWLVFTPVLLIMAAFTVLMISSLIEAFSLGSYDPRGTEAAVAPLVLWPAFVFAGLSYGISRLLKRSKAKRDPGAVSESGVVTGESASICMAIFFGGFAALAEAWNTWWTLSLWAALFLAWVVRVEARKPQKKPGRRRWRVIAVVGTCLATWGVIHYASFH